MNLYPLKGLPQQRQIWSWISYDVANQSFTLIVNTLLFSVFFTDGPVTNYDEARTQNTAQYAAFFHAMLDAGVYLPPSAYETWFVSAAHDDTSIGRIADALPAAAMAAAAAVRP